MANLSSAELNESEVLNLYKTHSAPEIAQKYNCKVHYIYNILKKNNIKRNCKKHKTSWNSLVSQNFAYNNFDEIKKMYSEGESLLSISRKTNIKRHQVEFLLVQNGVKIRSHSEQAKFQPKEHFQRMLQKSLEKQSELNFVSKPHQIVIDYLKEKNKVFEVNKPIGNYSADILMDKIVIEINGNYWHANPTIYKDNLNSTQKANVKRDKLKKKFLESQGYKIIYIWEEEIKQNCFKEKLYG